MPLFNIPNRPGKADDLSLAKRSKSKTKTNTTIRKSNNIASIVSSIKALCESKLGKYKDEYIIIRDEQELINYISACIDNNIISIDTETTGLDPMLDKLVGICIYTPKQKAAYIPLNHINYITNLKVENQLSFEFVKEQFNKIADTNIKVIMFNATFDIRFLRNQLGVYLKCYFDCSLAARCLNENEPSNRLKHLHNKYCLNGESDAWTFDDLFNGITFDKVPIQSAYLYAARDAEITYQLYEYQKQFLDTNSPKCKDSLQGVANVFWNIEMPCVDAVANMEDNGIEFDFDKQKELSEIYNKQLKEKEKECHELLSQYDDLVNEYKLNHLSSKLDTPINIGSPTQLAILLYDILKVEPPDKKSPRGTGEAILSKIDLPICKAILEYRAFAKLVSTYIDKMTDCVNPNDGRVHCKFNQYGADTGRFSSNSPNLQNIPSHNKDIRKLFKAQDNYLLMSSDFSQQEPKALAAMCAKQGDRQLLDTFLSGKDLYSQIASVSFGYLYEECKEFNPDGTTNKEGKERRTQAKSILLGILYGRGIESVAEQLHCSKDKAQSIKDKVFKGFPAIKEFEKSSIEMAQELGYVTTVCGRKRRLPDMQLPEYEFTYTDKKMSENTDLLDFDSDNEISNEVPQFIKNSYLNKLHSARYYQKKQIIEKALKEGILIKDNSGFISQATRQCVNSRIQGSAADLSKLAIIKLNENQILKELGFKMLIPVHDEIIAECPKENVKECSKLLAETMSKAAEEILGMPISCDVTVTQCWYGEEVSI